MAGVHVPRDQGHVPSEVSRPNSGFGSACSAPEHERSQSHLCICTRRAARARAPRARQCPMGKRVEKTRIGRRERRNQKCDTGRDTNCRNLCDRTEFEITNARRWCVRTWVRAQSATRTHDGARAARATCVSESECRVEWSVMLDALAISLFAPRATRRHGNAQPSYSVHSLG